MGIYYLLNNPYNIYTIEYCQKFLKDILESMPENYSSRIDLILKLKKDYSNIHHNYRTLIDSLSNQSKPFLKDRLIRSDSLLIETPKTQTE